MSDRYNDAKARAVSAIKNALNFAAGVAACKAAKNPKIDATIYIPTDHECEAIFAAISQGASAPENPNYLTQIYEPGYALIIVSVGYLRPVFEIIAARPSHCGAPPKRLGAP